MLVQSGTWYQRNDDWKSSVMPRTVNPAHSRFRSKRFFGTEVLLEDLMEGEIEDKEFLALQIAAGPKYRAGT